MSAAEQTLPQPNGRRCEACGDDLVGSQRKFCSNRCKQVFKNRKNADKLNFALEEIDRLRRENSRLRKRLGE